MRIAVIGHGNVGSGLLRILGEAGHEVTTIGRNDDLSTAVAKAEVVVLATPYGAIAEALLHKSVCDRSFPFPGRTYSTGTVTGMPRAV